MGQGHAGVDPNGKSITTKTFKAAAEAFGMTEEEAMKNAKELIEKVLAEKEAKKS
jgi:formylmethanofuran dehydrogenase subunit D